jgi:outer membrane protein assembly factor BamB
VATAAGQAGPDVTTYHYDNSRQGLNAQETILSPANVNATSFGKLGFFLVDGKVDAQPLYVGGLSIQAQTMNVLYVVTEHDSVYALDAATGAQIWKTSVLGTNETTSDPRNCGQIQPEIGITSTPVIDRKQGPDGTIFVVGMTKDASGKYHQRLHALDLATGTEQSGSPTEIQATYPGTGANSSNGMVIFDPKQYAERAGLLLLNGIIYTGWTSHCDIGPYTGWVIGYSESTLQQSMVLTLTPNGSDGSIWMAGFGIAADSGGKIYFLDANGTFDGSFDANGFPSKGDYGNGIIKLSAAGGKLSVSDYFEPFNTVSESSGDVDLGSGGAMLLPDVTDQSDAVRHLIVGAGKDGNIYVADRDNMGKFNQRTADNSNLYQELQNALPNGAFSGPAYFSGTVYYGSVRDVLRAFTITNAKLSTTPTSTTKATFAYPGTTPSVSSNGTQNGIVWALESGEGAPNVLHAYDPSNMANEFYNSNQAANGRDNFGDGNKFITPMVANGRVYVGTPTGVAVFGLLGQTP